MDHIANTPFEDFGKIDALRIQVGAEDMRARLAEQKHVSAFDANGIFVTFEQDPAASPGYAPKLDRIRTREIDFPCAAGNQPARNDGPCAHEAQKIGERIDHDGQIFAHETATFKYSKSDHPVLSCVDCLDLPGRPRSRTDRKGCQYDEANMVYYWSEQRLRPSDDRAAPCQRRSRCRYRARSQFDDRSQRALRCCSLARKARSDRHPGNPRHRRPGIR